jgi:hypothetical protein
MVGKMVPEEFFLGRAAAPDKVEEVVCLHRQGIGCSIVIAARYGEAPWNGLAWDLEQPWNVIERQTYNAPSAS